MKKLLNKKYLLSIGALASIAAPIVAVVSCSDQSLSDEDSKWRTILKKPEAKAFIEQTWLERVIAKKESITTTPSTAVSAEIDKSKTLKVAVKLNILGNLQKDPFYLSKKIQTVRSTPGWDSESQDNDEGNKASEINQLLKPYFKTSDINGLARNHTFNQDWFISFLFGKSTKQDANNNHYKQYSYRNQMLKDIVSTYYLGVNKDDWRKVFIEKDEDGNQIDKDSIDGIIKNDDNFTFIKELLSQHLFAKWTSKPIEGEYVGLHITKDSNSIFTKGENFPTLDQDKEILNFQKYLLGTPPTIDGQTLQIGAYMGYQGISTIKPTRAKFDTLSKVKQLGHQYIGYFKDGKFFNSKDQNELKDLLWVNNSKDAKPEISFICSLLPKYEGNNLVLPNQLKNNDDNILNMKLLLVNLNSSLYDQAVKYFTKRETNPIVLDIKNEDARRIYKDDIGFKFIK